MSMTYENIVAECKRLRGVAEHARAEFFLFLMRVQREYHAIWSSAGCDTFEQFLKSNNLAERDEYLKFVRGQKAIGSEEEVSELGACVTMAAGVMVDAAPNGIPELKERARAFVTVHRAPPSKETVSAWRREIVRHGQPPQTATVVKRASELEQLREENKRLRAELAAAKIRISELESETRNRICRNGKRKAA